MTYTENEVHDRLDRLFKLRNEQEAENLQHFKNRVAYDLQSICNDLQYCIENNLNEDALILLKTVKRSLKYHGIQVK